MDDGPCVTYIGDGGAGNFVKMVHNGIEYGDMQLISEAYDILKTLGGFTNEELCQTFTNWNKVVGAHSGCYLCDLCHCPWSRGVPLFQAGVILPSVLQACNVPGEAESMSLPSCRVVLDSPQAGGLNCAHSSASLDHAGHLSAVHGGSEQSYMSRYGIQVSKCSDSVAAGVGILQCQHVNI